ncbi:MAG TPA: hypothetical protein VJ779_07690 [Acetobacteraceae bacterium]|nr:hypothetical protein [Acetobacteraceae bacterium]
MRVLFLAIWIALSALGTARAAEVPEDLTIWWRTQNAEVVEHYTAAEERACSLVLYHDDDVLLFIWRRDADPALFIKHPGWRFGERKGIARVEIAVGQASAGPDGALAQLLAVDYRDWIKARLDPTMARILPRGREINVGFPNGQASQVSFPIDRGRMPGIMRGVRRCKDALKIQD